MDFSRKLVIFALVMNVLNVNGNAKAQGLVENGVVKRYQLVSISMLESLIEPRVDSKDLIYVRFHNDISFLPKLPQPKSSSTDVRSPRVFSIPRLSAGLAKESWDLALHCGYLNSGMIAGFDPKVRFRQSIAGIAAALKQDAFRGLEWYFPAAVQFRWGEVQGELIDSGIRSTLEHRSFIWQVGSGLKDIERQLWIYATLHGREIRSDLQLGGKDSLVIDADYGSFDRGFAKFGYRLGFGYRPFSTFDIGLSEVVLPGLYSYPELHIAVSFENPL